MSQRAAALIALFGFAILVMGAWMTGGNVGLDSSPPSRIAFQIATGSTEGAYFPVGQAMAGLISHPGGVGRCETATVCGPAGVILSARTSEGAADNLRIVAQGQVDSGLARGDVIAAAMAGRDSFRRPLRHLAVIAALFPEQAHLVAAAGSKIQSVADLRGKRVALTSGEDESAAVTARAILSAFGLVGKVRLVAPGDENSVQLLQAGRIDAYFTVSGLPLASVKDLILHHQARLVPIDGSGRDRLVRAVPQLQAATIPASAYPGAGAVETVAARAFWVTRDSEPDALIYGITRALFNPANRAPLAASHASAREIALARAADDPPAPIHPGAARFYREAGILPR